MIILPLSLPCSPGCKIKALRAKTNTYIKTPVRGEEPVFVVTGRKEDVASAKREIISAAEHFSQIRAQRKTNLGNVGPAPNAHLPGHVTVQVRVPYRVVGLVVGPKGATIKRIQQQSNTYIITPSREKDPVFEITGLPEDADMARREIEAHIAIRTGGILGDNASGSLDTLEDNGSDSNFSNSPLFSSLSDNLFGSFKSNPSSQNSSDPFATAFTSPFNANSMKYSAFNGNSGTNNNSVFAPKQNLFSDPFSSMNSLSSGKPSNDLYSIFSSAGSISGKNTSSGSYESDEGLGDSPTFDLLSAGLSGGSSKLHVSSSAWPEFTSSDFHRRSNSLESAVSVQPSSSSATSLLQSSSNGSPVSAPLI